METCPNPVKILFLISLFTISVYSQTNSWKGLTPLVSTRADVERILGKPQNPKTHFEYEVEEGKVSFSYQEKICDNGWNVPKDRLISIDFESKELLGFDFDELKLERNKFTYLIRGDDGRGTFVNKQDGVEYNFDFGDKQLASITFYAREVDDNLRCNGFAPFAPEWHYYYPQSYKFYDKSQKKKERFYEALHGFTVFFNELDAYKNDANYNSLKPYVLVYFDKQKSLNQYRKDLENIKRVFQKKHKVSFENFTFIEGGLREFSTLEFYIVRKDKPPPAPNPTLPSPQFMKKK